MNPQVQWQIALEGDSGPLGTRWSIVKTGDKLHDFLMNPKSRPDLQTPEAQGFLKYLEHVHNRKPQIDPLTPWLTREWKKGRIHLDPRWQLDEERGTAGRNHRLQAGGSGTTPDQYFGEQGMVEHNLPHWVDFLNSNHPLRREMGDIMQHHIGDFINRISDWDDDMLAKANDEALKGGEVIHQWPDNWSIRRLHTPEELKGEGDVMGHCVGGYHDWVRKGDTMIYSLRDPNGTPHVTTEITPTKYESPPFDLEEAFNLHPTLRHVPESIKDQIREYANKPVDKEMGKRIPLPDAPDLNLKDHSIEQLFGQLYSTHQNDTRKPIPNQGEVVQIQGKANREPQPEYKQRMREWFETFPPEERPEDADEGYDYIGHPGDIEDRHLKPVDEYNEYGLKTAPVTVDWDSMMNNSIRHEGSNHSYPESYADEIYELAKARGEIPELGKALNGYQEHEAWPSFEDLREQNFDYMHEMTGGLPEFREGWDQLEPEEQDRQMKEYEQEEQSAENELAKQHGPSVAANDMSKLLQPHWNPTTNKYENEPYVDPGNPGTNLGPWGFR